MTSQKTAAEETIDCKTVVFGRSNVDAPSLTVARVRKNTTVLQSKETSEKVNHTPDLLVMFSLVSAGQSGCIVFGHEVYLCGNTFSFVLFFQGSGPPSDRTKLVVQLMTISSVLYGVVCFITVLCIILAICFLIFNIKLRNYR